MCLDGLVLIVEVAQLVIVVILKVAAIVSSALQPWFRVVSAKPNLRGCPVPEEPGSYSPLLQVEKNHTTSKTDIRTKTKTKTKTKTSNNGTILPPPNPGKAGKREPFGAVVRLKLCVFQEARMTEGADVVGELWIRKSEE
ncbi:hypothetical protein FA15DRAFT_662040 [Coprinopsis marcescibilis]|uniref:Uncharacterized protein n=1 Tax=Coprinopsis marcescibilis TaxID=230819 RepID=A0A5C3K9Q2_COPMA|nr:hypothetical protein FA15DRAFT_662040 [Coprinopsis marcescibilis]